MPRNKVRLRRSARATDAPTVEVYGHIKLSRKVFSGSDPFWEEAREFSRFEAWVDVLQMAAWHPVRRVAGTAVDYLERGEFVASVRYLAQRWQWSKSRVQRWLAAIQEAGRIVGQREGQIGMVYRIVNYDTYQSSNSVHGTAVETPGGTKAGRLRDKDEYSEAIKQTTTTLVTPLRGDDAYEDLDAVEAEPNHHTSQTAPAASSRAPSRASNARPSSAGAKRGEAVGDLDAEFERFWASRPRRGAANDPKAVARKAWMRVVKKGDATPAELQRAVELHAVAQRRLGNTGDRARFVPMLATWLNQSRWRDALESASESGASSQVCAESAAVWDNLVA